MNQAEKKMLNTVVFNLRRVTKPGWNNGGFEKWTEWAKQMRDEINSSCNLLDTLKNAEFSGDAPQTPEALQLEKARMDKEDAVFQKEEAQRQLDEAKELMEETKRILAEVNTMKEKSLADSFVECQNCGAFVKKN